MIRGDNRKKVRLPAVTRFLLLEKVQVELVRQESTCMQEKTKKSK